MKYFVIQPAWALLLAAAVVMGNAHAGGPSSGAGDQPATSKAKKKPNVKTSQVSQIKFLRGSEETAQERSSRLTRECKGRVNAGACAGYTR